MLDPFKSTKDSSGNWVTKDSVANHIDDDGVDDVRVPQGKRTNFLSKSNKREKKYFNDFTLL